MIDFLLANDDLLTSNNILYPALAWLAHHPRISCCDWFCRVIAGLRLRYGRMVFKA